MLDIVFLSPRESRLFLVSSSSTTSTISTTTYCYVSNAAKACGKRKKRAIEYADIVDTEEDIVGSSVQER